MLCFKFHRYFGKTFYMSNNLNTKFQDLRFINLQDLQFFVLKADITRFSLWYCTEF